MKKLITLICIILINTASFAQGIVQQVIRNSKPKNVLGETFLGVQTTLPLSLGSIIKTGGKTTVPATYVYVDYGIYKNYTIGALIGYTSFKSGTVSGSEYDLLSAAEQIICNTDTALAHNLGLQCDKTKVNTNVNTSYTLLGLRGQYHIQATKKISAYGSFTIGYKAGKINTGSVSKNSTVLTNLVNTYQTASKVFGSTMLGMHYYTNPKKQDFAITGEAGYGFGWGDNIVLSSKTLLINLGLTYHIKNKNIKAVNFKK